MSPNQLSNTTSPDELTDFFHNRNNLKLILPLAALAILLFMIIATALYFIVLRWLTKLELNTKNASWLSSNGSETNTSSRYGACNDLESATSAASSMKNETNDKSTSGNFLSSIVSKTIKSINWFGSILKNESANLLTDSDSEEKQNADCNESNGILKMAKSSSNKKMSSNKSDANYGEIKLNKINHSRSTYSTMTTSSSSSSLISKIVSNENIKHLAAKSAIRETNKVEIILNFSIYFNETTKSLFVTVVSLENVKDLAKSKLSSNAANEQNLYIKLEIKLPARFASSSESVINKMAKTRFIKNKTNPIFDETFEYENFTFLTEQSADANDDESAFQLVFYVCNSNMFGRDQLVGQLVHPFHRCDLIAPSIIINDELNSCETTDHQDHKKSKSNISYVSRIYSQKINQIDSKPRNEAESLGQLNISLMYLEEQKTIRIEILNGTNIQMPKYYTNKDKIPNTFVKIYLLYRGQRLDKKETRIVENTRNPSFNETFDFDLPSLMQVILPQENLSFSDHADATSLSMSDMLVGKIASRLQLIMLVMDWDQVEKSDVIGKIELRTQHHLRRMLTDQNMIMNKSLDAVTMSDHVDAAAGSRRDEHDQQDEHYASALSSPLPNSASPSSSSSSSSFINNQVKKSNNKAMQQNWFDIFAKPNNPIMYSHQIINY